MSRPPSDQLIGKSFAEVPASLQRIAAASPAPERHWIGPKDAKKLSADDAKAYELAHQIMMHLAIQAPTKHKSGHPGGPLSAFTFAYLLSLRRDPKQDEPLRMSAGHLSVLAYGLQWLFGREGHDKRLASPQAIIDHFRIPSGLPGHVEAGIGDIPFGFGPLGKGVSNGLGVAFGKKYLKRPGIVDVLMGDGDSQEGQVMEAFRLAAHLQTDNLIVHGDFNDVQLSDLPTRTVAADFAGLAAACGWAVIEVQNGNDPAQVHAALELADSLVGKGRPIFACYYTTMGHGVKVMEEGSNTGKENFHGSPLKDDVAAAALKDLLSLEELTKSYAALRGKIAKPTVRGAAAAALDPPPAIELPLSEDKGDMRKDLGATHLLAYMKADKRIIVLHADLAGSGGFDKVEKELPGRVVNVGVAEANMYMMAAGMRQAGLLPVTYTFAAFATNEARANARLIDVNCGHTHCAVLHDATHAGLSVGEDGETHQERHYLNIPFDHTQVWMPADSNQVAAMAKRALAYVAEGQTSVFLFSPRSGQPILKTPKGDVIYAKGYSYDGAIDIIRGKGDGSDQVTILAVGQQVHTAVEVADKLLNDAQHKTQVRVLNVSCIRPIDAATVIQAALETQHLIVIEDHSSEGGLATQVADIIADFQLPCSLRRLGVNHYFPSAKAEDLLFLAGLDADSLENAVLDEMRTEVTGGEDALVTCLFAMLKNLGQSRFRSKAQPFVDRLINEAGYLDTMRVQWAKRTVPASKLPKNAELRERLGEATQSVLGELSE